MPSLRVRIKNQVHKGFLEQKDADRLMDALDHEDQIVHASRKETPMIVKVYQGLYGQTTYGCPNCGKKLAVHDDTRYCEYCGQKISFAKYNGGI